ncbi:hypothetical protein [Flavobacterium sp. CLA17]|uniref:hypothetical protein n=1 Tax=Flavobacterium sp. CLA17 TaxID=2724135 RepID=UPI0019677F9E|nr:hypothetical protein [Flavobacterium sp. CLA17]QSB25716.1 hypothetical protein HAV12_015205 [Flavobacterium sp. CLA17]
MRYNFKLFRFNAKCPQRLKEAKLKKVSTNFAILRLCEIIPKNLISWNQIYERYNNLIQSGETITKQINEEYDLKE